MRSRVSILILFASSTVHAAGFQLGETGAAATGMVGAFTAKADDATAIFYNAAGIARLRGLQVYVGGMLVIGQTQASTPSSLPPGLTPVSLPGGVQENNTSVVFIPNVYVSYGMSNGFALGIGAFTNFGLKNTWPAGWAGRAITTWANLEDVTINPTIAWRPVEWFSVGGGVDITPARVELRRVVPLVATEADLRFVGNSIGIGGNVGVLFEFLRYHNLPRLTLGSQYRSAYDLDFDDGALQTNRVPIELSAVLHDSPATTNLRIPDLITTGVGVRPTPRLFLQVQFDWTNWSRLQTIELRAEDPALNVTLRQRWRDGYTLRFGGELALTKVSLRLGFGVDWTPAPATTMNPIIPDANRYLVSAGIGTWLPRGFALEGSLMGVIFQSRTSTLPEFPVQYDTWAVLISAGVSYHGNRHERGIKNPKPATSSSPTVE